jgi:hypothetical protein
MTTSFQIIHNNPSIRRYVFEEASNKLRNIALYSNQILWNFLQSDMTWHEIALHKG